VQRLAASLELAMPASMVDEDTPHQLSGDAEEMRAALPVDPSLARELEIGLVDERGGLERVIVPLPRQIPRRERVELGVHERDQALEGVGAAALPFPQQASDIGPARAFLHEWRGLARYGRVAGLSKTSGRDPVSPPLTREGREGRLAQRAPHAPTQQVR